jgi:hypothetical protein
MWAHSTTKRIKSTWKPWFAWWLRYQLTTRSAGIAGSMCNGQTSRTSNIFEGSSCGRVCIRDNTRVLLSIPYQPGSKTTSVVPFRILSWRGNDRREKRKWSQSRQADTIVWECAEPKKVSSCYGVHGLCVAQPDGGSSQVLETKR